MLTHFISLVSFYTASPPPESIYFSDVFKEDRKIPMVWNFYFSDVFKGDNEIPMAWNFYFSDAFKGDSKIPMAWNFYFSDVFKGNSKIPMAWNFYFSDVFKGDSKIPMAWNFYFSDVFTGNSKIPMAWNFYFSDVFKGNSKIPMAWNGLNKEDWFHGCGKENPPFRFNVPTLLLTLKLIFHNISRTIGKGSNGLGIQFPREHIQQQNNLLSKTVHFGEPSMLSFILVRRRWVTLWGL